MPEWDIADVVAFHTIRKSKEEDVGLALRDSDFGDDYVTLEIWALEEGPRKPNISDLNPNLKGSLIIKRASDTSSVEGTKLNIDVAKLAHESTKKEALEKAELIRKFDKVFNDYNASQKMCVELKMRVQLLEQGQIKVLYPSLTGPSEPSTSKLPPIVQGGEVAQLNTSTDVLCMALVPYDDDDDNDEPDTTRSTKPNESQLLEKSFELENKLKE